MPKGFCTRVHLWGSSYNTFLLTETFLLGQFLLRPVNQLLAPGGSIHQVCGTIKEPIFVEWYHNKEKVGSCLFQTNTTSSTIGNQNFKLFIGRVHHRSVCHLTVQHAKYDQTGEYSCRTVHPTSEGETASALILVYHPIVDVRLEWTNETALSVNQETTIICVVRGGKPNPSLRLQIGGQPITNTKFKQNTDADGILISTMTADLVLGHNHHWNLLTCHVDMDVYRNVNQTHRVVHLNGYRE
ncbi:Phospholipase DDHD1 [Fasciolopsis buskii]|uniref:Phospholipase DDHD1 n=1 Tax=Fasciolopsis buskii TaxID=27845 RepID=A0A8E0RT66_9TREM|nr:Phospholipase DDHD1 [Fasciolopsis buski]